MNKEGADLEVVVPSDGVISADYPLTPLSQPANDLAARQTEALGQWLEANSQVLADHFLRPVSDEANLPESMTNNVIIELPFPGDRTVTDRLIEAYDNDLRVPGESVFVLDTSGSMFGDRIADLQATMRAIVDGSARTETGSVGLRNRRSRRFCRSVRPSCVPDDHDNIDWRNRALSSPPPSMVCTQRARRRFTTP